MIYFIITLLTSYLLYYIFTISKYDDEGKIKNKKWKMKEKIFSWLKIPLKEKDEAKLPAELEIFIVKYRKSNSRWWYECYIKGG